MIIKIGAAVIDGNFPDTNGFTPVQEIDTQEGRVVLARDTSVKKGLRIPLTVSLTQQAAVNLLVSYRDTQAPVAMDYIDPTLSVVKNIGSVIVESVNLQPLDQAAWAMMDMQTLNGIEIESIRSGSVGLIVL